MKIGKKILLLFIIGALLASCASQKQSLQKSNEQNNQVTVVAVLPVINKTSDTKVPQLLRMKVSDQLYFKGYAKLAPEAIDKKLSTIYEPSAKKDYGVIAPQVVKQLTGADAVMYCQLNELKTSVGIFYAPVEVSVSCEMRNAEAGNVLWNAKYTDKIRNFHFTRSGLELKSREALESLIDEVVDKVLDTLPAGPKFQG